MPVRSISIAGATARFEALGFAAGVGYGSEAVGTGGVGIGEVVDLAEGTRALDEALALQRADVAAQVVGKGFVERNYSCHRRHYCLFILSAKTFRFYQNGTTIIQNSR